MNTSMPPAMSLASFSAPPSVAYKQNIDLHPEPSKIGKTAENASPAPANVRSNRHSAQSDTPVGVRPTLVHQAREKSLRPMPDKTLSRSDIVEKSLDRSSALLKSAKQVGVDIANRTFMRKCVQCIGHGLVIGLAASLAVASLGGATPFLVAAAVVFGISTADAGCAYKNRQASRDIAEGKPAKLLIGGSSAITNLSMLACRAMADKFGKNKQEAGLPDNIRYKSADNLAAVFSAIANTGVVVASFATGLGINLVGMAAAKAILIASKAIGAVVALTASVDSGLVGGNLAVSKLDKYIFSAEKDGSDPVQAAAPRKGAALTDLNFSLNYLLVAQKADPAYFEDIASPDQKKLLTEWQQLPMEQDDVAAQMELTKDLGKIAGDPGNAWSQMIAFGAGIAGVARGLATA